MQERHIFHVRRMSWISWLQSMPAFSKKSILMLVVLLAAFIMTTNLYGQNASTTKPITVQGQVMDSEGVPIPGVNIRLKGQNAGTISDLNGNYKLSDVTEDAVIEFSFIGFATLEKKVKGETLNAILLEDTKSLDEVEVVAFGTQKKESVIGSISTLKPAELKVPTSNLTNALAGRVAGVIAYQRTGEPGVDDSNFFIRGVTSFGYAKSPLILIGKRLRDSI